MLPLQCAGNRLLAEFIADEVAKRSGQFRRPRAIVQKGHSQEIMLDTDDGSIVRVVGLFARRSSAGSRVFLLFALVAAGMMACGSPPPRPDIVLITLDVLRADRLSLYGYPRATSPNLDAFAERAVVFDGAVTVSPSTAPSMASLMTSKYPFWPDDGRPWGGTPEIHHGMMRFFAPGEPVKGLPDSLVTLAEELQATGYRTGAVVTNPYLKKEFNFQQGFDDFDQFEPEDWKPYPRAEQVVARAIAWLGGRDERPSFLFLHFMDIHAPYAPPPPYNRFFPAEYIEDGRSDRQISTLFATTRDNEVQRSLLEHNSAMFDNCIRYVDTQLGALFRYLEGEGILDDALVVIHADHGEEFLEHGDVSHKGTLFDEQLRIPLVVFYPPSIPKGRRVGGLVRQMDIMPTILDLLEIPPPYALDGVSMVPLLQGRSDEVLEQVVGAFHTRYFVRDHQWKWIGNFGGGRPRLFDLGTDPAERTNLCADRPEVCDRFGSVQREFVRERLEKGAEFAVSGQIGAAEERLTDETRRQLEALGYLQ